MEPLRRPVRRRVGPLRHGASWLLPLALLTGAGAGPVGLAAQAAPADPGPWVLEQVTCDRWIPVERGAAFVPPTETRETFHLRVRATLYPGNGSSSLTLRRGIDRVEVDLDGRNRVIGITIDPPPIRLTPWDDAASRARQRRRRLTGRGALLNLPSTRVIDIPFAVPGRPMTSGTTWIDTLSLEDDPGEGLTEAFEAVRHNEVVGDTVLGGRRLPVVRVHAEVRYTSASPGGDTPPDRVATVERDVRGTVEGRVVVDTVLGIRAGGADTTRWEGTAVLRTGDGRELPAAVRYERTRRWALRDSTSWADSTRASERLPRGMLGFPPDSVSARVGRGDPAALDSLLGLWRATADATERAAIERLLSSWAREDPEARLRRMRLEVGDTAGALLEALDSWRAKLSPHDLDVFLPWLDDPGRLWRHGLQAQVLYDMLATHVRRASPLVEPDSARWTCEPAACRRLAAMRDSVNEPGLADVALVLSFVRDPARWEATLRARSDEGSAVARSVLPLADGIGATWPAAPNDPMPPPGADWRAWLSWLGGELRWEPEHAAALRVYAAEAGRDPLDELAKRWPPEGDSARLVLGTILEGMERLDRSPEEVEEDVLTGSGARIELARTDLQRHLRRAGERLPADVAARILLPLLDSVFAGGGVPWPSVGGRASRFSNDDLVATAADPDLPLFLVREGLPEGVESAVHAPVEVVDSAAWMARPVRAGGVVIRVEPPLAWGDFASIHWEWTQYEPREPDEPPAGYAGGAWLDLLRTEEGWRVVNMDGWIT